MLFIIMPLLLYYGAGKIMINFLQILWLEFWENIYFMKLLGIVWLIFLIEQYFF